MGEQRLQGKRVGAAEVVRTLRSQLALQGDSEESTKPKVAPPRSDRSPASNHEPLEQPAADDTAELQAPASDPADRSRYIFMNELGRGGMGRVDEVFDNILGRSVAQKSLRDGTEVLATTLVSEAQTCAQLEHPAIVPVYDLGATPEGLPFYTMRRIRGRTLYDVLRDVHKPASRAQLLTVLRQICLAVDYAHSRGVVHRDLKPENVSVGEFGEVYVLDWGIAELLEGSKVRRTPSDTIPGGSPGYMAPEQIRGLPVDARTDVFSLGVMLYEALSGFRLFDDRDARSLATRATDDRSPLRWVPPGVLGSSHLEALVRSCIEVDPDKRPASARSLANAIEEHLDGERDRAEREREAAKLAAEGGAIYDTFVALEAESRRLLDEAEEQLAVLAPWAGADWRQGAWGKQGHARRLAAEAARTLARAETAFLRALGRVEDHRDARAGMARLHFRQFEDAERHGDPERMAQHLDLARTYDDGQLSLELCNEGALRVQCTAPDATLEVARYEPHGPLLELARARPVRSGEMLSLAVGSWVVTARRGTASIRAPILIGRARQHVVKLVWKEVPSGMVLIPGGPFLAPAPTREVRMVAHDLPDLAIGVFPVTFREYVRFLEALSPEERAFRTPRDRGSPVAWVYQEEGTWHLAGNLIEGPARLRVPPHHALDLPVVGVSWFDALAYARWLGESTGLPYRLPTSLEWDKAARGVDGRPFPMGLRFDPSFAKMRESRPEASQPEPVGAFPTDCSPYLVRDMAGGVNDWTCTVDEPLTLADEHRPEVDLVQATVRGGAWTNVRLDALLGRGKYRVIDRPGWVGFRVALDLEGESTSLSVRPQ